MFDRLLNKFYRASHLVLFAFLVAACSAESNNRQTENNDPWLSTLEKNRSASVSFVSVAVGDDNVFVAGPKCTRNPYNCELYAWKYSTSGNYTGEYLLSDAEVFVQDLLVSNDGHVWVVGWGKRPFIGKFSDSLVPKYTHFGAADRSNRYNAIAEFDDGVLVVAGTRLATSSGEGDTLVELRDSNGGLLTEIVIPRASYDGVNDILLVSQEEFWVVGSRFAGDGAPSIIKMVRDGNSLRMSNWKSFNTSEYGRGIEAVRRLPSGKVVVANRGDKGKGAHVRFVSDDLKILQSFPFYPDTYYSLIGGLETDTLGRMVLLGITQTHSNSQNRIMYSLTISDDGELMAVSDSESGANNAVFSDTYKSSDGKIYFVGSKSEAQHGAGYNFVGRLSENNGLPDFPSPSSQASRITSNPEAGMDSRSATGTERNYTVVCEYECKTKGSVLGGGEKPFTVELSFQVSAKDAFEALNKSDNLRPAPTDVCFEHGGTTTFFGEASCNPR